MIKKQSFIKAVIGAAGVTVIAQAIGLIRQVLVAAYFGISRDLDIYFMTYAIAMLAVFAFGVLFDTVSTPHLVKTLEEKGEKEFKKLTGLLFTFSIIASALLSLIFVLAMPIFSKIMAAGFSPEDRAGVCNMALYFMPWTLIFLPYYALCSFFKSIRHFNIVFAGEILISCFSLASIFLYHPDVSSLPIAYFAGYAAAFLLLFTASFKYFKRMAFGITVELKKVAKNFTQLFMANQVDSISAVINRFLQSFMASGEISALSYSTQLSNNLSGLLSFRDIFIVPLSSVKARAEKLERAVIGLSVISVPIMFFIVFQSNEIISILFKRGKFDAAAVDITAVIFWIYSLSLLPGVIGVPLFRMFQIIDKIKNTAIVYGLNMICFIVLGSVFIFYFKFGARGIAMTMTISAYLSTALSVYLLYMNGVRLNYTRILKYIGYSSLACLAIACLSKVITQPFEDLLLRFGSAFVVYCLLVAAAYLPLKSRLFKVIGM